ncbi:hypothetical protein BGX34_003964 [Mortierella sp. NVP85]|nr:hypothetical protein BGX34_003964 [Mortierella sp. NVP85]
MPASTSRAVELPEILHTIAYWVPLFEHDTFPFSLSFSIFDLECTSSYTPHHLRSCTLVCRSWNTVFTPYLYQFYLNRRTKAPRGLNHSLQTLRKHSHLFRRYQYREIHGGFTLETDAPPMNLVGLFVTTKGLSVSSSLLCSQGSQLRQLSWIGAQEMREMDRAHLDALTALPCLEELELSGWILSNESMYRILSGCASTLRTLKLERIKGFDEDLFLYGEEGKNSRSKWALPHLKSLELSPGIKGSHTLLSLPQLCPALESIHLSLSMDEHSVPDLVSVLRENCPNLHTIYYQEGPSIDYDYDYFPDEETYASLFKDSFLSSRLQCASMGLPTGLDHPIMEAFLFHATTLVTLHLMCRANERSGYAYPLVATMDMEQVLVLLEQCRNLKDLRLVEVNCLTQSLEALLAAPWQCCDLEYLVIIGYTFMDLSIEELQTEEQTDAMTQEELKAERERIRQSTWPRRFRHHEYRDDGQGWFLKPGLSEDMYTEAIADNDWKRRLFEHMYTTSGLRKVRRVNLNSAVFFSHEQAFESQEAERAEMEDLEGLVVDYRKMDTFDE